MISSEKPSGTSCPREDRQGTRSRASRSGLIMTCIAVIGVALALVFSGAAMTFVSASKDTLAGTQAQAFATASSDAAGRASAPVDPSELARRERIKRIKAMRAEVTPPEPSEQGFTDLDARLRTQVALANAMDGNKPAQEIALATELAKRVLARRLSAPRTHPVGVSPEPAVALAAVTSADGSDDASPDNAVETETGSPDDALTVADLLPEVAPLPTPRPDLPVRVASVAPARASARTTSQPAIAPPTSSSPQAVLAYARATDDLDDERTGFGGLKKIFRNNPSAVLSRHSDVAIYDIRNSVVYMPDGTKLEAHSGKGHMKDNPKFVNRRGKGPTPPNVYNLRMREARFHGVEAIRMLPVDQSLQHGRDGFLTHTPLLRGTNGSSGCVAFKHYDRFLKAFKAGKVKRMIVVPDMSDLPTYVAML